MRPSVFYGVAPVRFLASPGGRWEFDWINGAWGTAIFVPNRGGEYVDAVVWDDSDDTRWWTRFGAVPILGRENAALAATAGWPVRVYATPRRWMLANGRGVCVLDWNAHLRPLLDGIDRLIADSQDLADKINRALGRTRARHLCAARPAALATIGSPSERTPPTLAGQLER
jgi:hypothetical protein